MMSSLQDPCLECAKHQVLRNDLSALVNALCQYGIRESALFDDIIYQLKSLVTEAAQKIHASLETAGPTNVESIIQSMQVEDLFSQLATELQERTQSNASFLKDLQQRIAETHAHPDPGHSSFMREKTEALRILSQGLPALRIQQKNLNQGDIEIF